MTPTELITIRNEMKLTQQQLADLLFVSRGTLSGWERGLTPVNRMVELAIEGLRTRMEVDDDDDENENTLIPISTTIPIFINEHDSLFDSRIFSLCVRYYCEWRGMHGTKEERTLLSTATSLGVSIDTLERWRHEETLPRSPGKMVEVMCRMILCMEQIRMREAAGRKGIREASEGMKEAGIFAGRMLAALSGSGSGSGDEASDE